MKIRIVTVEREYGSGGAAIAERLAKQLGWKLWDRELTAEIARVAKVTEEAACRCDERVDPMANAHPLSHIISARNGRTAPSTI
ncbi:MAG TPA: cytidylate kinase family protein [Candidatus Cybelea sp.]|nr:cytidylate kinase family protein [Candidatus Cybelea sp.]